MQGRREAHQPIAAVRVLGEADDDVAVVAVLDQRTVGMEVLPGTGLAVDAHARPACQAGSRVKRATTRIDPPATAASRGRVIRSVSLALSTSAALPTTEGIRGNARAIPATAATAPRATWVIK